MAAVDGGKDTAAALAVAMFEGSVDPALVLSADGVVLRANRAAQAVFGDDVVGGPFGVPAVPGEGAEIELHTPAGVRTAELRVGRAQLSGDPVLVATLRDVTDRRRVEQALRDFVSTASHEFRTPLFAITGFAETLTRQWQDLDDADRLRYIGIMHRQAARLSRLTDDLLTVARLDGEGLAVKRSAVRVGVVLKGVLSLLDEIGEGMEVALVGPESTTVLADPDHVEEMLINLLSNAMKYGAPPFEVATRRLGDRVEIAVVDHGEGVPGEFQDRMFGRFSRERVAARREQGTGLGLAIVRGLAERNGGSVTYRATPGGGATFVVELPTP